MNHLNQDIHAPKLENQYVQTKNIMTTDHFNNPELVTKMEFDICPNVCENISHKESLLYTIKLHIQTRKTLFNLHKYEYCIELEINNDHILCTILIDTSSFRISSKNDICDKISEMFVSSITESELQKLYK